MQPRTAVRILFPVLLLAGAGWLLVRELRTYRLTEIVDGLAALPPANVCLALGLTLLSYVILIGYDWLAVRSTGHSLPLWRIAFASFCGHAVSYNFGALLGGGAVRCRLYAAWGLPAFDIVRLLAMLGVTFWVGAFALAGIVLLVAPPEIPASVTLPLASARPLGFVLLLIAAGYVGLTAVRTRPLTIGSRQFRLPSPHLSALQITIASIDLISAAAVLYWLLPVSVDVGFGSFLGIYLLATVVVLITHVPGGVGVFELVVLSFLSGDKPEHVMASLLVFRAIYLLLPLVVAFVLLGAHEVHLVLVRRSNSAPPSDSKSSPEAGARRRLPTP